MFLKKIPYYFIKYPKSLTKIIKLKTRVFIEGFFLHFIYLSLLPDIK